MFEGGVRASFDFLFTLFAGMTDNDLGNFSFLNVSTYKIIGIMLARRMYICHPMSEGHIV